MTPVRALLGLAALASLGACGRSDPPLWGVLHGHLDAENDDLAGFFVWEFYEPEWGRKSGEERHRCARLLSVAGVPDPETVLADCEDCTHQWALTVADVDQDCPGSEGQAQDLRGMTHLAVGPLRDEDRGVGRHGDARLSVRLSWDGETTTRAGVVWDEGLDLGEPPAQPGAWTAGRRMVLWPAQLWRLRDAALVDRPGPAVADTGALR